MHEGAYRFIAETVARLEPRRSVIELGSRCVAGWWPYSEPVRPLFADALEYIGVDVVPGPNVDVVANAAAWQCPDARAVDTVVCTETLEHTPEAEQICRNAWRLLSPGGVFLVTTAGEGRAPHSGFDGGVLRKMACPRTGLQVDEFYRNVSREELRGWLEPFGFWLIDTATPGDIYALAVKLNGRR
jgi:SAM-dependent methyltransferase